MCILESERLILRPPRPCDIHSITAWLGDYDVARMTSRVPHPYNEGDAEAFLALGEKHRFVIQRRDDLMFLGMIGLQAENGYEFGYWLGKPFWGHGYATEAAHAIARWGFERSAHELFAVTRVGNDRAVRLAERLGMQWVGETEKYYDLRLQVFRVRPPELISPT